MEQLSRQYLKNILPKRKRDAQKGDFGRLLCITGSESMPGACKLSTEAALRCGAGLVTVATAEKNINRLAGILPEAMWRGLKTEENGFFFGIGNTPRFKDLDNRIQALLIGPGIGRTEEVKDLVTNAILYFKVPTVIDADALWCLKDDQCLFSMEENVVITPHPGEMSYLTGLSVSQIQQDRWKTAMDYVKDFNGTLVLKGAGTIIANDRKACINPTGNPGMSRGGSGDVLAGMIAAFLAQGLSCYDASCLAVYLHGLAGDLAAQELTEYAMLPSDIISHLGQAFQTLLA